MGRSEPPKPKSPKLAPIFRTNARRRIVLAAHHSPTATIAIAIIKEEDIGKNQPVRPHYHRCTKLWQERHKKSLAEINLVLSSIGKQRC
jgi:hypothetical protein